MIRRFLFLTGVLLTTAGSASSAFPSDEAVLRLLKARIDTFQQSVGIVVGMVDSTGSRFISYGPAVIGGDAPVDEHTIFEVGSISKVFTSILLADAVLKGDMRLDDPAQNYLPDSVVLPSSEGRVITLGHLATHRSGLPRMPSNFAHGAESMEASYSLGQMYSFLDACTLTFDISERYLYSNLGFGLLGQILANHADTGLNALLVRTIADPLGLPDTRFTLTGEQTTRAAGGHDWNKNRVPLLNFDAMAGAGSLRSSATDLLAFIAFNAGLKDSPLWPALQYTHIDREDAIGRRVDIGLGWHTVYRHGRELILHTGATFGNMCFAGFDKEARRGVVVMSNSRGIIDDIGVHLLDPETKAVRFTDIPKTPTEVELNDEQLQAFVGEYAFGPNAVFVVRFRDGKLYGGQNAGLEVPLKTASANELFSDMAPILITFKRDKRGKVIEVTSSHYGVETTGEPIEYYLSPAQRRKGSVDNLDAYVGTYEIEAGLMATITRRGDRLFVQADDQLQMRLIPTVRGFYAYEARATLVFEKDPGGGITGLTVHQDGVHKGARVTR